MPDIRIRNLIAVLCLGLLWSSPLAAFHFQKADDIYLSGEFQEDVMLAGGTVNFDGTILGDLIAASNSFSFDGMIDGNLNAAARRITVSGEVCRSVRTFAETININSRIDGDITAFGSEITIGSDAVVGRDIALFGTEAFIDGTVGSDAYIYASTVTITGRIEGNVKIKANRISIAPGAYVGGDFNYESKEKAKISSEAQVMGETRWKKRTGDSEDGGIWDWIPPPGSILWSFLFLLASLVTGVFVILVRRDAVISVCEEIRGNGAIAGLLGLGIILLVPFAIVLTSITFVGLPAGLMGLTYYFAVFLVGKVFVAITIGMILLGLMFKGSKVSLGWSLVIGLILLALLFKIPVVGWLVYIAAWAVGAGAVTIRFFRKRRPAASETAVSQ